MTNEPTGGPGDGPVGLVALARSILEDAPRRIGADRTIAAALVIRQALEASLDLHWAAREPAMADTTMRDQLITLPYYPLDGSGVAGDAGAVGEVVWAWNRLSSLCHHRAYEMPAAPAEIRSLAAIVERFARSVEAGDERPGVAREGRVSGPGAPDSAP